MKTHLLGSIMHSMNVSLLNPGECESKITQDYPHLLEHYSQDSCVCGQPTNPANNICKVDIGSALACTTGDNHYVLRGIYSWDSGCQTGNQLASFYKFDLEWYEWAIGLIESVRFEKYTVIKVTKNKIITQGTGTKTTYGTGVQGTTGFGIKGSSGFGIKGSSGAIKSSGATATAVAGSGLGIKGFEVSGAGAGLGIKGFGLAGQGQSGQFNQFGSANFGTGSGEFSTEVKGPIQKTFTTTITEKKFFQTEPKFVTYTTKPEIISYTTKPEIVTFTTKPEIVTFTTKPEYFTYTTKPKYVTYTTKPEIVTYTTKPEIVTYTTKPEIITYTTKPKIVTYTTKPQIIRYDYQTSGSQTNQQVVAPSVSFNPSFSEVVGAGHVHDAKCKCLEGK
uniref:SFRICE_015187 n=1 Tax=Spodoptera frugiperda TaxID=7108 RepID=A0A2H1VC53_SPOFR